MSCPSGKGRGSARAEMVEATGRPPAPADAGAGRHPASSMHTQDQTSVGQGGAARVAPRPRPREQRGRQQVKVRAAGSPRQVTSEAELSPIRGQSSCRREHPARSKPHATKQPQSKISAKCSAPRARHATSLISTLMLTPHDRREHAAQHSSVTRRVTRSKNGPFSK